MPGLRLPSAVFSAEPLYFQRSPADNCATETEGPVVDKTISLKDCNPLCRKCLRACRQTASALLLDCPRYFPRPFKIVEHRFDQLDLFDK